MRYLPLTPDDRAEMLGVDRRADHRRPVRRRARRRAPRRPRRPAAARRRAGGRARARRRWRPGTAPAGAGPFFCGAGAYRHHVPASVDHIIQRSEFLTSYTPYQPEIAQGTLQVLFEFQTQVAALTGMRGGQRLDVRRLHRLRRGGDDGRAGHPPEEGGPLRRPASALRRDHPDHRPRRGHGDRAPGRRRRRRGRGDRRHRRRHRLRRRPDPQRLRHGHRRDRRSPRPPTPPAPC